MSSRLRHSRCLRHRRGAAARRLVVVAGAGIVLIVAIAVFAMARSAHGGDSAHSGPGGHATSDIAEVAKGDFDIATTATGELRARNQIEIRNTLESETSIVEIIPEGTTVKQGDVLVKLNAETIQTRLDEESLSLESARAEMVGAEQAYQIQLSENESTKRQADLKLAIAELDLEQWRQGEVESKKLDLDNALDRAEKDESRLKDKLDKSIALEKKGYYSQDQLKQDDLAHEAAVAALEKARLDKQVYWSFQHPKDKRTKESAVEEAKAEEDRVLRQNESHIASKAADRSNKQRTLQIREQKHAKAVEQLAAATIKATGDGLVVYATSLDSGMRWGGDEGPLQVGRKVYPNELLIALPDTSEMIASVKVHESLASRLKPGLAASVKIDAASEKRFTGKVESIGILAEQTSRWMDPNLREYTVKIALDPVAVAAAGTDKAHGLKPSMRCESEIFLGKVADAITVPIQAVFSDGLVRYVYLPDGSRFTRRPVQIGQRSERFAEVKVGLQPGQHVLLRKPEAAEVLAKPWEAVELTAVGLQLNDQGTVIPIPAPAETASAKTTTAIADARGTQSTPAPSAAPPAKETVVAPAPAPAQSTEKAAPNASAPTASTPGASSGS